MIRDILRADYGAHEALTQTALGTAELWRLAFGVILVLSAWIFFLAQFEALFFFLDGVGPEDALGTTPVTMLLLLLEIALLLPATAFVVFALHKRVPGDVFGAWGRAWQQFVAVFVVQAALIGVIFALPPYGLGGPGAAQGLGFGTWLLLLPLALPLVLAQCAAEEYAFRGYLQQQLAARFAHPAVWMLAPSALFALGHYDAEGMGDYAWHVAGLAGLFGLMMADLTARAGTLGPAIAVHWANNIVAMLFVSTSESFSGLALVALPIDLSDPAQARIWLPIDLASMIVSWLAARLVLQR